MPDDDTKPVKLAYSAPKPCPNFNAKEAGAQRLDPRFLVGALGGPATLKSAFPAGFMVADVAENTATLHLVGGKGRPVEYNHNIDAIAFITTPSHNHFDIVYMRGAKLTETTLREAENDPKFAGLDAAGKADLAWDYYTKARGDLPAERNSGGFYVVAAEYAVASWDLLANVANMLGLKVSTPPNWSRTLAEAKQHVSTCDCENCKFATEHGAAPASRYAPLPLLDADRNVVPRPDATFADTPTTADAAKVSDALSRAQKMGWGNGNPQSILVN